MKYHSVFSPPLSLCDLGTFIQNIVEYIICAVVTFVYCVLLYEKGIYKVGNDDDDEYDAKDDVKPILFRNTINIVMSLFLFYLT